MYLFWLEKLIEVWRIKRRGRKERLQMHY